MRLCEVMTADRPTIRDVLLILAIDLSAWFHHPIPLGIFTLALCVRLWAYPYPDEGSK